MFYKRSVHHCISEIGLGVSPFTLKSLTAGREATSQGVDGQSVGSWYHVYKRSAPHCISEIGLGVSPFTLKSLTAHVEGTVF